MARSLSMQFLGPNHMIEIIPHTALVVFGKEYFFGGGIQSIDPHTFRMTRGIYPIQTQHLGRTQVSQDQFEGWCQSQESSTKYNMGTYHLLNRNCNHFSHDAAILGLQLKQGVPDWILQVPQRVLSSPMGRMFLEPMLQQMQPMMTPLVTNPTHQQQQPLIPTSSSSLSSSAAVVDGGMIRSTANPWASLGGGTSASGSSTMTAPTTTTTTTTTIPPITSRTVTPPPSETATAPSSPSYDWDSSSRKSNSKIDRQGPILDKYTTSMLSNDTKTLNICVSKLSPYLEENVASAFQTLSYALLMHGEGRRGGGAASTETRMGVAVVPSVVDALWRLIQDGRCTTYALLFLRLIVLSFATTPAVGTVLLDLMNSLVNDHHEVDSSTPILFSTPASKSLAWCVASNYAGSTMTTMQDAAAASPIPLRVVDAAIRDWNHDSVQVRQAASTFLYNYVVSHGIRLEQDEETVVSLVCSSLESLVEETDPTTRLRRLLVGSRVVFGVHHSKSLPYPTTATTTLSSNHTVDSSSSSTTTTCYCNEMAKDLVKDLGFVNLLQELAMTDYGTHTDTIECQQLALELMERLQADV